VQRKLACSLGRSFIKRQESWGHIRAEMRHAGMGAFKNVLCARCQMWLRCDR
jgi:hypothetical protein